jgi:hypothetical protein
LPFKSINTERRKAGTKEVSQETDKESTKKKRKYKTQPLMTKEEQEEERKGLN